MTVRRMDDFIHLSTATRCFVVCSLNRFLWLATVNCDDLNVLLLGQQLNGNRADGIV
jgi:hypothetical protein